MENQKEETYKANIESGKARVGELVAQKKLVAEKIKIIDTFLRTPDHINKGVEFKDWALKNKVDYSLFKELDNFSTIGDDEPIDLYVDTLEDLYENLADETDNEDEHVELLEEEKDEYESFDDEELYASGDDEYDEQWFYAKGKGRKRRKDKRNKKKNKRKAKKSKRKDKKSKRKDARKDIKNARKDKRQTKKQTKKELRDKYGKGKDYRQSKKDAKKDIKAKKRAEITRQKKIVDKNRTKFGKFGKGGSRLFKKVAASAPRNAFLAILKLNVMGLASRLKISKDKNLPAWTNFLSKWKKIGGGNKPLIKSVDSGSKHKPKAVSKKVKEQIKKSKESGFDGEWNYLADGVIVAIITAIPVIITALLSIKSDKKATEETKGMGTGDDDDVIEAGNDQAIDSVLNDPNLTDEEKDAIITSINSGIDPLTAISDVTGETKESPIGKYFLWGGIGVVGVVATVLIVKAIKSSKKKGK